jgi:hypothetical protein
MTDDEKRNFTPRMAKLCPKGEASDQKRSINKILSYKGAAGIYRQPLIAF